MKKNSLMITCFLLSLFMVSAAHSLVFEKAEYRARRERLMDQIPDGVAIFLGAQLPGSYMEYYQNNDFMYFTGVEIPDAILIIDSIKRESTLFFTKE